MLATCGDSESPTRAFLLLWGTWIRLEAPAKGGEPASAPSDFSIPIGPPGAPPSSQRLQAEPPCCPPLAEIVPSPPPNFYQVKPISPLTSIIKPDMLPLGGQAPAD